MLELRKIARDIDNFGRARAEALSGMPDELSIALDLINRVGCELERARSKINNAKTSWLVADFDEPPDKCYALPSCPIKYSALAVDGSQIAPGKHEIALCYLVNTSAVLLSYGANERPWAETWPQLCYKDDEIYEEYAGRRVRVSEKLLSMKRTLAESAHMERTIRKIAEKGVRTVAFWDGSLIRWTLEGEPPDYKERALSEFLKVFDTARGAYVPIAGYISDPGSRDLVNSLRIMLCPDVSVDCERCNRSRKGEPRPCDAIAMLTDSMVFARLLQPGQRSVILTSNSQILGHYGEHEVRAFYINLGREMARIEIPKWVASNGDMLDFVHAACWDQVGKGRGYPIVLAEAHKWAVVQASERKAFFELIERSFIKHGVPVNYTLKRISKGV